MKWLITAQQNAGVYALDELNAYHLEFNIIKRFNEEHEVILLESETEFADILTQKPPIFIRHICPVGIELKLVFSGEPDLANMQGAIEALIPSLEKSKTFSIQSRFIAGNTTSYDYKRYDVNEALSTRISEAGFSLSVREPEQIISVAIGGDTAYMGVSRADKNLSDWAGGVQRFKYSPEQISRAEFKLLEAISLFRLPIGASIDSDKKKALDLGAAPGGWTRVLRQHGFEVAAVDPANLHPSLYDDTAVKHYPCTAQNFLKQTTETYDLIANDMRMDALLSADLMCQMAPLLRSGGSAVMTLKLAQNKQLKQTKDALEILKKTYTITIARQLFHNRNEVTVLMCNNR